MAEKTISREKLRELADDGADIEFDPKSMSIERFDELLKALETIANNEAARVRADIERNQTNLEILATLQSMIRKQGGGKVQPVDLSPIRDLLLEVRAERHTEPADYDFNIVRRGGDGFQPAMKIEARAVKPTAH